MNPAAPSGAAPTCLAPLPVGPVAMPLPAGTCDSHFHLFDDPARYPLDPRRNYTPAPVTLAVYRGVMQACGIARAVFVQPSVYGNDNRLLLDTLRDGGPAFRGVIVPRADIGDAELASMHALGVRGVRLNLVNPQMLGIDAGLAIAARMRARGWHLQVHVALQAPGSDALLERIAARAEVPVVVDHMGRPATGARAPDALLRLLAGARVWVKLSAPYRIGRAGAPWPDVLPLVRSLVEANPERLVWGSDWPHSELFADPPNDADLVDVLPRWLPDEAVRRRICVENPVRLYGFPAAVPG